MKRTDINGSFQWDAGIGPFVYSKGKAYIDFTSGIFTANLGHNFTFDAVVKAIGNYGPHCYTYGLATRDEYLKRLCEWSGFEHAHLFTTGSEAVEAAMRVCWHLGYGADDFYALPGSFHGKTWGPDKIALRLREESQDLHKKDVILVEGYRGWDCHFWSDLTIESVKNAGVIIMDEIQSGFGRTGTKFAFEHYKDLHPDMVVIGKGMGNGIPVSAVLANGRYADVLRDKADEFSSTHGGNPLACASGLAVLDEFEKPEFWYDVSVNGTILQSALMQSRFPVNGKGMVASVLTESQAMADEIVLKCRERGLLVVHTGKSSVKIGPPINMPVELLTRGAEILIGR